jgi:putative sigma-54 modulation protein
MQIKYFSKNFTLTSENEASIEKKLASLEKIYQRIMAARVNMIFYPHHKEKKNFEIEIKLEVPGQDLYAKAEADNLASTFDLVEERIKDQLREFKDRPVAEKRHPRLE